MYSFLLYSGNSNLTITVEYGDVSLSPSTRAAERGGPGGLLTLGPVVNHGARAALHYKWSVVVLF